MLRLFSSIRQSLLAENKTSKYLKYAIGEFILVVLGILVALQINNWNENRKLEEERRVLIENLKEDFETNLALLEKVHSDAKQVYENLDTLRRNSGGEPSELTVQEIKALYGQSIAVNQFEPVMGAYQSALSTGLITMLGSRDLNTLFRRFEERNRRLNELESSYGKLDWTGLILEMRSQIGSTSILRGTDGFIPEKFQVTEQEFRKLIARKDVYAIFDTHRIIKGRQLRNFRSVKETIEQILTELEAL